MKMEMNRWRRRSLGWFVQLIVFLSVGLPSLSSISSSSRHVILVQGLAFCRTLKSPRQPFSPSPSMRIGMKVASTANTITDCTEAAAVASSSTTSSSQDSESSKYASTVRYKQAVRWSHSFMKQDYKPAWFATNAHIQTVLGALYRKETMYMDDIMESDKVTLSSLLSWIANARMTRMVASIDDDEQNASKNNPRPLDVFQWDDRQRVWTHDGDFHDVDWKYSQQPPETSSTRPVVLICHGLETNSNSPLAQDMAIAFNHAGFDVACINFRGCSGELNLTPRGYHLGFYDDLLNFCKQIHDESPNRRIYLSGFSLGAGVVTKMLADLGDDAHEYSIAGAAVNAVPMDCGQCSATLNEEGFSKAIYGKRLLKSMQDRIRKQYDSCQFPFEKDEIDKCRSIMDVENLLIAPTFGFEDAWDYYDKCKTVDVLDRITVPELIVQALDDPFFEGIDYPMNNPQLAVNIQYTTYGGHCGYVFHTERDPGAIASWMPFQLARFLAHLEQARKEEEFIGVDPKDRR